MSDFPLESTRFFAHGVRCLECEYVLGDVYLPECPECGMPTHEISSVGEVLDLSEAQRAMLPTQAYPSPDRYIDRLACKKPSEVAANLLMAHICLGVIVGVIAFGILPVYTKIDMGRVVVLFMLAAIVPLGVISVTIGYLFFTGRYRAAGLSRAFAQDIEAGKAECYQFMTSHALVMRSSDAHWLAIRSCSENPYTVLLFPADVIDRLGVPIDTAMGLCVKMSLLPRSRVLVDVQFSGEEVCFRETTAVKPRWLARKLTAMTVFSAQNELILFRKRARKGSYFTSDPQ